MWDDLQHSIIPPSTRRRQGADLRFEGFRGDKRPGWAKRERAHERAAERRQRSLVPMREVVSAIVAEPTPFGVRRLARLIRDPRTAAEVRVLASAALLDLAELESGD